MLRWKVSWLCLVLAPALALAETRIALVIGNGAYSSAPLLNPANDAKLVADTLTSLGFDVIVRRDADQATMKRALQEFGARLEKAGVDAVGLFYYAGHGVQLNGRNYLIPTKANIEREGDVEIEAVSADWVLEQMRYARNRLNIVILDACRNNPFVRSMRSADRGLAKMDAPAGTLIAYSTAPGDVAADGTGRNSPYTLALAQAMRQVRQPVEQVFKQARVAGRSATSEKQTPWESSSLTGDFYFVPSGTAARPTATPLPQPAKPAATPAKDAEVAYWQGVQSSTNADDFKDYLQRYPNGLFTSLAQKRLASLQQRPTASVPAAAAPTQQSRVAGACGMAVGRWTVPNIPGEVVIKDDQTVVWWKNPGDKLPAVSGTWVCDSAASRRFVLTWGHGSIDTVTLSADGRALSGRNQLGLPLGYFRAR
jgi:hypothetical protein